MKVITFALPPPLTLLGDFMLSLELIQSALKFEENVVRHIRKTCARMKISSEQLEQTLENMQVPRTLLRDSEELQDLVDMLIEVRQWRLKYQMTARLETL